MKIFDYCESAPLFLIEQPFNALSSLTFILVALLLFAHARKFSLLSTPRLRTLILIGGLIGVGSLIWHTRLSVVTFAFDVIPIFAFIILYQAMWYREYTVWNLRKRTIAILILLGIMVGASLLWNSVFVQKSNAFVPIVFWLFATAYHCRKDFPRMAQLHRLGAVLMLVAIALRMGDVMLCPVLSMGTHFLWHIFCAMAVYAVARGYMEGLQQLPPFLSLKWIGYSLLIIVLLMVSSVGYILSRFWVPLPAPTTTKERIAMFPKDDLDFTAPTTIYWNKHQIPYIVADRDEDAAYALGLVHAHLRLGQMEMARRIVYGRLSEVAGPVAHSVDETLRVIDFPKSSRQVVANFPRETKIWVDRYIQGINDYITRSEVKPHEFELLGLEYEPWKPEDVVAIGRLAGTDYTWLVWYGLMGYRDSAQWERIWNLMLDSGSGVSYEKDLKRRMITRGLNEKSVEGKPNDKLSYLIKIMESYGKLGSNSLVVGAKRSRSGAPMIANDPHLGLSLPNLWFVVGMHSPSYRVVGMMAPGLPMFGFGRNEHIAWGGTNVHAANSDLYDVSDLKEEDFTWHEETIKDRFWVDDTFRYRTSKYGPVISDAPLIPKIGKRTMALKWMGHGTSDEITAMLKVNRARNWEEFSTALDNFSAPAQNMLYADIDGNIGKLTATMVPFRKTDRPKDIFSDKAKFDTSWNRIINHTGLPSEFIPRSGYLVSANDPTPPSTVAIGYFYSPPDRALRLAHLIEHTPLHDLDSLKSLQRDVFSAPSLILRDVLIKKMEMLGVRDGQVVRLMREWDGQYYSDSRGALAFQAFLSAYAKALYGRLGDNDELAALNKSAYFEDFLLQKTEAAKDEIVTYAFKKALKEANRILGKFNVWGDVHRLELEHSLSSIPFAGHRYKYANIPTSGSRETVMKRAHGLIGDKPEAAYYGAQSRQISDLADPNANYFVLIGGQDGWIESENFFDQAELWQKDQYIQMPLDVSQVRIRFPYALKFE